MPFSLSFRPASLGSSPSLSVPLSQDKGLETGPFPLELSWLFHSRWLSSFPSQPSSCSGNSSYTQSATGNDPNCFVPLGQSKYALVWDAFMYQIPTWPDFSEVLGNSGQSQWVPKRLSILRHVGNSSIPTRGDRLDHRASFSSQGNQLKSLGEGHN